MAPSTPWTTDVDAPFHPQPPNAFFHVAGFPRRKFETSATASLWVRLCSVVATVPGPRGPQQAFPVRPGSSCFPHRRILLGCQPAPHSGIWRTSSSGANGACRVVKWNSDTALGSLSAAPAPSDDSSCVGLAGRPAGSLSSVVLVSSYRVPRWLLVVTYQQLWSVLLQECR